MKTARREGRAVSTQTRAISSTSVACGTSAGRGSSDRPGASGSKPRGPTRCFLPPSRCRYCQSALPIRWGPGRESRQSRRERPKQMPSYLLPPFSTASGAGRAARLMRRFDFSAYLRAASARIRKSCVLGSLIAQSFRRLDVRRVHRLFIGLWRISYRP